MTLWFRNGSQFVRFLHAMKSIAAKAMKATLIAIVTVASRSLRRGSVVSANPAALAKSAIKTKRVERVRIGRFAESK